MAFAVSPQQTVLWDQIEYSGAPQDFAWVLPVMPGAQVQLSHDEFFAALDALSDPVITGPAAQCGGSGGGGCGSIGNGSAGGAEYGGAPGVQVVSQGVVGPYDTVTLHATDPNALYDWLNVNSYDVPSTVHPVIDAYVAGGFDFIALRLAPGQGVQAMQPVRVVTPGAGLTLPLRMVAAGVGSQVGITLYVISDGRYEAQDFPNATVDDSKLVWLHGQNTSNYEDLAHSIMQGSGGRTWLTEFSGAIQASTGCSTSGYGGVYNGTYYGSGAPDLGSLYFSTCDCLGSGAAYGGSSSGSLGLPVADAGASGIAEGGAAADAGLTAPPYCSTFDDLDVALTGIDPQNVWVTRMKALLPSDALSEGDLVLRASASQSAVSNRHTALVYDDPSYSPCASAGGSTSNSGGGGCTTDPQGGGGVAAPRWLLLVAFGFVVTAVVRRRWAR